MAAELVLTFAAEGILTKVSSLAAQELALAWGFKAELEKLGESVSSIQDFLRSAADQRGKEVDNWVKKLKQVAEDADDILDDFNYELLRRKVELHNHMKRKVLNFLSASNPLLFRLKMAHKIKKINDSLAVLKSQAAFINLVAKQGDPRQRPDREQTDSFLEEGEKVVGRKDVVRKMVTTLISSDNQQKNLSVMAIVGMAGLGKTTLAKSVYNEPAIDTHFPKRIWVCVSNTFEVDTILSQMVESLTKTAGMKNQDTLLKILREELTGKRYVLVLDDVWNEERENWDSLMSCLSKLNSNPGSCIIVTTRSTNVSTIAETLPRPELRNLSKEECWSIIKQRALNLDENGFIDAELERIGKAIAEKCGGVPLVAKVLGSLLRSRASKVEWLSIRDNRLWELPEGEDRIMKVLKLSFDNLEPSPLKQCFAYCSMLGKDFEIERDNLIQLWMAQGLLQTSTVENHHEMEHTGEVYFNILLNNSLFQEVIEGGTITKYRMHDLAEEVSKSERLTQELNDDVRHVARSRPFSTLENMSEVTVGRLRSLFSNDQVPEIIFSKFKATRVLSLDTADIKELPNSFGKLKHLRYLDLSKTRIKALPKSIGKLYNLQTLRMQNCDLNKLPREMQNLINLRHLYVDPYIEFPAGMFRGLTNLRTLSCFNVGEEMGCRIEELGGLNQLKGMLTIRNLENVRDEVEAKKAKLEEKKNVVELSLVFSADRLTSKINDENVLEGLQPHTELESLWIKDFMGDRFPSWMMRVPLPLNNLKKLVLVCCNKCGELPILGHLPFLRDVEINGMDNLKRFGSEIYGYDLVYEATREKETIVLFPALKTLRIYNCPELIEWMEAPTTTTAKVEVFPCLEKLKIYDCPSIGFIPIPYSMASLRELRIYSCNALSSIGLTSSQGLPSLRKLIIECCDGLSALPSGIENCTSLELLDVSFCENLATISFTRVLPSFRKLQVVYCNNLSWLAVPEYCPSLQELSVRQCPKLASITFSTDLNPCLEVLIIEDCNGLHSLPDFRSFTSLRVLYIEGCAGKESLVSDFHIPVSLEELRIFKFHNLESIPRLEECISLRRFGFGFCDKLKFPPTGLSCLARLEDLWLGPFCEELDSFPDFQVPSQQLVSLWLIGWPKLKSLPQQVQQLTSLTRLTIRSFKGVEALPEWLGNLASLVELCIWRCDNLKYLPSREAMQRLTKLDLLSVYGCPLLKQRCTKGSGEEWPKISHIPHIEYEQAGENLEMNNQQARENLKSGEQQAGENLEMNNQQARENLKRGEQQTRENLKRGKQQIGASLNMKNQFSGGLELANFMVTSGAVHQAWAAIEEQEEINPDAEMSSYNEILKSNPTIIAFCTPRGSLQGKEGLISSADLKKEDFSHFEFLCNKSTPCFSINESAINIFRSNYDELNLLRNKLVQISSHSSSIIITGRSVGGCVAILFTLWLLDCFNLSKTRHPLCITFGSPLLGDEGLRRCVSEFSTWKSCFLHIASNQDPIPKFFPSRNPSSTYKPFGTFLLCSASGCACFEEPDSILEWLVISTPHSSQSQEPDLGQQFFDYGKILEDLEVAAFCKDDMELVDGEIYPFQAMSQRKNVSDSFKKLSEMQCDMAILEWHKKEAKRKNIGLYDMYKKLLNTSDIVETDYKKLKSYWKDSVAEEEFKPHKEGDFFWKKLLNTSDMGVPDYKKLMRYWEDSIAEEAFKPHKEDDFFWNRWLLAGTSYRRMVEPLHIAEYYKKGARNYITDGRPRHFILLEQWWNEREKPEASQNNAWIKRQVAASRLNEDSCFWAHVEEAIISCNLLNNYKESNVQDRESSKLKEFEGYVYDAINKNEVSLDIFLEGSSFREWWNKYEAIMGSSYCSSLMRKFWEGMGARSSPSS